MKKEYTLLIFNNGFLISLESPSYCLFNSNQFSLKGKPIEDFFIPDSIEQLRRLENGKKTKLHLCAKASKAILNVFAIRNKFQQTEVLLIYITEDISITNSDTAVYEKHSVLDIMMMQQNEEILQQIEQLKTTRNIPQIKRLKETFYGFYNHLEECVLKLIATNSVEKYQFESFQFSSALKNYFDTLEQKHPDKHWVSYHNFLSAQVLGNRERLISLLDAFLQPQLSGQTKMIVSLKHENDSVFAELTVLNKQASNAEFAEELADFSKNEISVLAKKAGCTAEQYYLPGIGTKLILKYDALTGYHLYEDQK